MLINDPHNKFNIGVSDRLEKSGEQQIKSPSDKNKVNLEGAEVESNMASPVRWDRSQSP